MSTLDTTPPRDEKVDPDVPTDSVEKDAESTSPIPLPPPEALFVAVNVHLEDLETRALRMRRAYHMSVCLMWMEDSHDRLS
jgi:hypothetical protein